MLINRNIFSYKEGLFSENNLTLSLINKKINNYWINMGSYSILLLVFVDC